MPADTRYAIAGTGNIGSALATHFGRAGVEVRIANTRGPGTISELAASAGPPVLPASLAGALACEVIFMAIPFTAVEQFARELSDWTGKTIIDTANAHYAPGHAEQILKGRLSSHYVADVLPSARVVKAFNQLPAQTLAAQAPDAQGRRVVFISSDSAGASADIAKLTQALGLSAVEPWQGRRRRAPHTGPQRPGTRELHRAAAHLNHGIYRGWRTDRVAAGSGLQQRPRHFDRTRNVRAPFRRNLQGDPS